MNEKLAEHLAGVTPSTAGDEVNKVVDNLAGKIGMAVDKVAPVADKVITEISYRGIGMAVAFFILAIVGSIVAWKIGKKIHTDANGKWENKGNYSTTPNGYFVGLVATIIAGLTSATVGVSCGFYYLNQGLARRFTSLRQYSVRGQND